MDVHPHKYGTIGFDPWPMSLIKSHQILSPMHADIHQRACHVLLRGKEHDLRTWQQRKTASGPKDLFPAGWLIFFAIRCLAPDLLVLINSQCITMIEIMAEKLMAKKHKNNNDKNDGNNDINNTATTV